MTRLKGIWIAACLAAPLPLIMVSPVSAETATPAAKAETSTATTSTAKADEGKSGGSKMSEADRRAKAMDCSRQADAKKLHGAARKKFRSACKHR